MEQPKLRLVKRDKHNWAVERWQDGGVISRGRYTGQQKKEQWDSVNPIGYYPTLAHACTKLLDVALGDLWPTDGWTGKDMQKAIDAALEVVLEAVKVAEHEEQDTK